MKILYAFQGLGNGHIARARELVPQFAKFGEVTCLVGGDNNQVGLNYPIRYRYQSLHFNYNDMGSIDILKSIRSLKFVRFVKEIASCPVKDFDLVINDAEAVTAWACAINNVPCVSLGHGAAFNYPEVPRPPIRDLVAEIILTNYAPAQYAFGIHLEKYNPNIFTPVIRSEIRNHAITKRNHITVYIAFYKAIYLESFFVKYRDFDWHIFSKEIKHKTKKDNISLYPINNEDYIESLASCTGLFTGAGFEGPTEALFLGKKLMVIPLIHQYEQYCNAEAFKKVGVRVVKKIDENFDTDLNNWLYKDPSIKIDFPDNAYDIAEYVITFAKNKFNLS
ncbi:glycosyl transferase [candidate division WWE3 bacterium]|nr:glycosyl transferase [candidate division WWE3 bacterium]